MLQDIVKIADFGSCTYDHKIDYKTASKQKLINFQNKVQNSCTMMYRAPELID